MWEYLNIEYICELMHHIQYFVYISTKRRIKGSGYFFKFVNILILNYQKPRNKNPIINSVYNTHAYTMHKHHKNSQSILLLSLYSFDITPTELQPQYNLITKLNVSWLLFIFLQPQVGFV